MDPRPDGDEAESEVDPLERVRRRLEALRVHLTCGPEAVDLDLREIVRLLAAARQELDVREDALVRARRSQEKAERDYRDLFEGAPDGYLVTDPDGTVTEANREARQLLGPDLDGESLERLVARSQRRLFQARMKSLCAGRAARIQDWQLLLEPPDRAPFHAETTVEPRIDRDGEIVGLSWMVRDVTERQRAAEALRESEARFRAIYENAAVGIRVADLGEGGRVVQANRAYQQMLRYSEQELLQRTVFDTTHPDDVAESRALLDAVQSGERADFQIEQRLLRKDDTVFWARLTVSPVLDRSGRPVYVIGVVEDISERKRAERQLQDALARTQALLDSAIDSIVTIDESGTIESVNPATERLFGYRADELKGRNVRVLMPGRWAREHDSYLQRYRETGEARIIGIGREVTGRHRDGREFPADLAVSEVQLGDRRFFMGILRDITERRETEEELRRQRDFAQSLVDTARAIVLVLDPEGRIVLFNRYLEEVSGYRLEDLRGQDWVTWFIPGDDQEAIRDVFAEAITPGLDVSNVNEIVTKSGDVRTIDWQSTTLLDREGRVTGLLAIGQDVTDKIRLEDQFRQAQKMEAVGRLAGGIAHDFNTLLGSSIGYTELLLERLDEGSEEARLAQQILRTGQRGAALTRQLLTFSRRQRREVRILDPGAVVEDLRDMLQRLLGEDVTCSLHVDADIGHVEADQSQLEQVVVNLAVNAGDAMPRGGRLEIRLENVAPEDAVEHRPKGWVRLTVADTGEGMDAATKERIFEPFFTTKEIGRGTGLGLSTVYAIVEQAGGRIRVESEPGQGTTFRILLPRSGGRAEESAEVGTDFGRRTQARGVEELVLVVEDDEMFRGLIREVLESAGFRVVSAENPAEALEILDRRGDEIEIVLTDLVMPGMTGRELVERVRGDRPEMKVVFMSGYSGDELERREVEATDVPFLRKPFGTGELLDAIRRMLDVDDS